VRRRLPQWINQTVQPVIEQALVASGLQAELRLAGNDGDKLIVAYPAIKKGIGYAAATIQLKFGARAATGMTSLLWPKPSTSIQRPAITHSHGRWPNTSQYFLPRKRPMAGGRLFSGDFGRTTVDPRGAFARRGGEGLRSYAGRWAAGFRTAHL
jgi:hypothetical protein